MNAWEQVIAAGGVILLALALRLVTKPGTQRSWWQPGARARGGDLEVVGQLRLTPQHSIHVVRFTDRLFVISTHAAGCALLDQQPVGRASAIERSAS